MSDLERAIFATVAYTDQFHFPLKEEEIWQRLIVQDVQEGGQEAAQKDWQLSFTHFQRTLGQLVKQKKLREERGYFFLADKRKKRAKYIDERLTKEKYANAKNKEVRRFCRLMWFIPWVKAVFVTGSLAMNQSEKDSDIDFMIITGARRLWLSRAIIAVLVGVLGKRRTWRGNAKNTWCLNLWLDTDHLVLLPPQQTLYHAYEIIQARPVFQRKKSAERFYVQNAWVTRFLPNWKIEGEGTKKNTYTFSFPLFSWIDWVFYRLQLWYMKKHRTSEKIDRGFAFFHPRNTAEIIMKKWEGNV